MLRAVTMLVIAGAAFWAGQSTPLGALPELLQPSMAPAEPQMPPPKPHSELLLQLETERNLVQSYSTRVEKLSAQIASLQSQHSTEQHDRLARHQEELRRREKQLRALEAKSAADGKTSEARAAADSKAEKARLERSEKTASKALADARAQQAQMRTELERLQKKLTRAQEVGPPTAPLNGCSCLAVHVGTCQGVQQHGHRLGSSLQYLKLGSSLSNPRQPFWESIMRQAPEPPQ